MTIKQNKIQTFLCAILGLVMLIFCIYCLFTNLRDNETICRMLLRFGISYPVFKVIVGVGAVFFAFGEVYFAKEMFSQKLLIEICDDYFYDNSSAVSFGKIPWSDMERAYIKNGFLHIKLKNPDAYLDKKKGFAKKMIQANTGIGYEVVCISTERFKKNSKKFFEEFEKRMEIEGV